MSNFSDYIMRNPRGRRHVRFLVLKAMGFKAYRRMVRQYRHGDTYGTLYLEACCKLFNVGTAAQAVLKTDYKPNRPLPLPRPVSGHKPL